MSYQIKIDGVTPGEYHMRSQIKENAFQLQQNYIELKENIDDLYKRIDDLTNICNEQRELINILWYAPGMPGGQQAIDEAKKSAKEIIK